MSIETIYGDLVFGDKKSLSMWRDLHDQAHQAINDELEFALGQIFGRAPLDEDDPGWYGQHFILHTSIAASLSVLVPAGLAVYDKTVADNEQAFYQWHQIHNDHHRLFDEALGLV